MRRICFTTPLKPSSFGPEQAECVEEYTLAARSADAFHISMSATTPNVILLLHVFRCAMLYYKELYDELKR